MRKLLVVLSPVAIITWTILIFYFSSQFPSNSERQAAAVYEFLKRLDQVLDFTQTDLYLRLRTLVERAWFTNKKPSTGDLVRKTAHFGLYFVLGVVCFSFGLLYNRKILSAIVFGIGLPTVIAVLDEYNQILYHRGSSLNDVMIDMTGATFGVLFSLVGHSIFLLIKRNLRSNGKDR